MTETRIVLVADDSFVRGGIGAILGSEPTFRIVGEAGTLREACALGARLAPSLFVIDIGSLKDNIVETVKELSASGRSGPIPVVLLLGADTAQLDLDVLRLGGCAIIRRRTAAAELVAAVRMVAAGYLPIERALAERLALTLPQLDTHAQAGAQLTKREREVFLLIARGMSNAEIAAALTVASSTVKSHVQDIFRKLGLRDRVQAVIYAYESTMALSGSVG
ncbi:DNA-binding response regulator, NarL/FixJ family, contains REC and HTH domains [Amycolatopsis xylanica]|uniref:DNA-binding response regulator, NarL/FixJ family, contains REC and HTH domains n=1 Tax=Amycolatopsis xylanica TaxID=589385 RepID=A0A1H3DAE8_9PSEU|nr:response regulator transcription factor [Amycolatopsis xylanica]SDX63375.1 DNA-binding response regulator, NarL/FixJ family, contains REC and HTH domains [Amycolatopsis xylanica]